MVGRLGSPRGERDDGGRFDGGTEGGASSRDDRAQRGKRRRTWDVGDDARARKPREVSAEERINATATAVIKAGSSSGHSVEAFNGSSDDMAFSDRLALATAKISTLAAQLKEKTASAREARAKEKALGGKELLRRLQETASSQSAQRAPGLVSLQSMRRGEDAAGTICGRKRKGREGARVQIERGDAPDVSAIVAKFRHRGEDARRRVQDFVEQRATAGVHLEGNRASECRV